MEKKPLKYIKGFFVITSCVLILMAFIGKGYPTSDRLLFGGIGLLIFLLSTLSPVRWFCLSLFSFCMVITGLPQIINEDNSFDIYYLLLVVAFFIVGIVYTRKTLGQFRLARISKIGMAEIDKMTGLEFEEYTAILLKKLGYSHVEVTKASGDQGIDVLAKKDGLKYAIQCKNYSRKLDNTPIQEAYAGKAFYKCDIGVVITNSTFTDGAKELARSIGILLWDRTTLQEMISTATNGNSIEESCAELSSLPSSEKQNLTTTKADNNDRSSTLAESLPSQEVCKAFEQGVSDYLLPSAIDAVFNANHAAVSTLQRRMGLRYLRAARLIDEMEEKGVVGPFRGERPREILITKEQWNYIRSHILLEPCPQKTKHNETDYEYIAESQWYAAQQCGSKSAQE